VASVSVPTRFGYVRMTGDSTQKLAPTGLKGYASRELRSRLDRYAANRSVIEEPSNNGGFIGMIAGPWRLLSTL